MSEETQKIIETPKEKFYPVDWSGDEGRHIQQFKKDGMPGLAKIRAEDLFRMHEMYLGGSTYSEISMAFHHKKILILFLSEKECWYKEKAQKAEMTAESLSQNYNYIKADSALFFTELVVFWQNYYREKIKNYQKSKDPSIVENMDLKPLEKMLKVREMLDKLMTKDGGDKSSSPLVNIDMSGGGSISQNNGEINITPTNADKLDSSKVFEILAELKKQNDLDPK